VAGKYLLGCFYPSSGGGSLACSNNSGGKNFINMAAPANDAKKVEEAGG